MRLLFDVRMFKYFHSTGSTLTELFKPMEFKESFTGRLSVDLQVCHRHDHFAKLHIRLARLNGLFVIIITSKMYNKLFRNKR